MTIVSVSAYSLGPSAPSWSWTVSGCNRRDPSADDSPGSPDQDAASPFSRAGMLVPGFIRCDFPWTEVGAGGLDRYERTEIKPDGSRDIAVREQAFEVVEAGATVDVLLAPFELAR